MGGAGWVGEVERGPSEKKIKKEARLNGEPFPEVRLSTGAAHIF